MARRTLPVLSALLVACQSAPPSTAPPPRPQGPAAWTALPSAAAVLEQPLAHLPPILGVDPRPKTVGAAHARDPYPAAYPSLRRETLDAWKRAGQVLECTVADDLVTAFFGELETGDSAWHTTRRVQARVDDPSVSFVELLLEAQRPVSDLEVRLRAVAVEPRFAAGLELAAQLADLGVTQAACSLEAVHPVRGAVYAVEGRPGKLLVTAGGGRHAVTATFQGPLPAGFVPWDELVRRTRARHLAGQPLGPLTPWLRHVAFGEVEVALGGPLVSAEARADLEGRLQAALSSRSPASFLDTVRYASALERGARLDPDAPAGLLASALPRLASHAHEQAEAARAEGLPVLAGTWGWLAWRLHTGARVEPPTHAEGLAQALVPVLLGQVRYTPEVLEGTPLARRSGADLSSAHVLRAPGFARWTVRTQDVNGVEGLPNREGEATITWTVPNPKYATWYAAMEDLQDQIDFNLQSTPTIDVPTGRLTSDGRPEVEQVPDTSSTEYLRAEELQQQLDALALDEPPLETERQTTVPVVYQRYSGVVARRYTVLAEDGREVDRFDEVTEVDLELKRHRAVPEAGVPALDEHRSLEEVLRGQERGLIEREPARFYREVLGRALRPELARRVPEGVPPERLREELAWGQWWWGLEVDDDLRPALGDAAPALAGDDTPILGPAPRPSLPASGSRLEALLAVTGEDALPE